MADETTTLAPLTAAQAEALRNLLDLPRYADPMQCPFHCTPRVVGGSDRGPDGVGTNWYEHAVDCEYTRARMLLEKESK